MALFYDRDFGRNRNFDNTYRGRGTWGMNEPGWGTTGYDAGYQYSNSSGFRGGSGAYDRGYAGYDRNFKSRWQTDNGDPFGDRIAHTPMRMIRGGYHTGYDRNYMAGSDRETPRYGRDYYEANPMGYDPYGGYGTNAGREGTWMRGYDRGYNTRGRGYDTGWF